MKICQTSLMAFVFALVLPGCGKSFELQSSAFQNNGFIPGKYGYGKDDGRANISLPFNWINPPEGTQSFALIFYHPNFNYIRWAVFNIPASCNEISENASGKNMPEGSIELPNFRRTTPPYYGPEPQPESAPYKYIATLFALNVPVINGLEYYKTYWEINELLDGKVIAKTELTGVQSIKRRSLLIPN
ncbi:MAG: YbhB/YbcL family Raf kinase inhibitor-like protein [Treponema sp.]|jgi:Raf kinase inhibitor-like YbhB/YbcL family protein|nr:YbhB/YbcL family Raf kinase inhibitor-like protein [Treponema sp.]